MVSNLAFIGAPQMVIETLCGTGYDHNGEPMDAIQITFGSGTAKMQSVVLPVEYAAMLADEISSFIEDKENDNE